MPVRALVFLLAGLLALWLGGFKARTFVICALLIVAVGDGLISNSLKKTVNRPRPSQSEAGVRIVTLRKARPQFLALFQPPLVKVSKPETTPSPGASTSIWRLAPNYFPPAIRLPMTWQRCAPIPMPLRIRRPSPTAASANAWLPRVC